MPGDHDVSAGVAYQTCLLDLGSGTEKKYLRVQKVFPFTKDSHYLVLKGRAEKSNGVESLSFREKFIKTIANINSYVLDPTHQYLAYLCRSAGSDESHLEIINLSDFCTIFPQR